MKKELLFGICCALLAVLLTAAYAARYSSKRAARVEFANSPLSANEVSKHNSEQDCWLIIENGVYNVTQYIELHPGGRDRIISNCGTDATQPFVTQDGRGGHSQTAYDELKLFYIGDIGGSITTTPDTSKIQQLQVKSEDDDN